MSEPPVSLVGIFVEGYIVLRFDAVLIGKFLHFGGADSSFTVVLRPPLY
jgi:hypothetical protein